MYAKQNLTADPSRNSGYPRDMPGFQGEGPEPVRPAPTGRPRRARRSLNKRPSSKAFVSKRSYAARSNAPSLFFTTSSRSSVPLPALDVSHQEKIRGYCSGQISLFLGLERPGMVVDSGNKAVIVVS